jgi:hypothetical protein
MTQRRHPTWSEVRDKYLSDPEVAAAAEELHHLLVERPRPVAVISGHEKLPEAL